MNYADDSCHLARTFGTGDDAVTLEFRQFAPSISFELLIAGHALKGSGTAALSIEFGPGGAPRKDRTALQGQLSDGRTVFETSSTFGFYGEDKSDNRGKRNWKEEFDLLDPQKVDRTAEAAITQLRIGGPVSHAMVFRLGPMDKPMDAMRTCLDELLTHWGIDAAAHHRLRRRATPAGDPAGWLGPNDYPAEMLRRNRSGVVHFRLMVGVDGKPTACDVQTGGSDFDKTTCALLMKRARFLPALDSEGKAIASYYANAVRWLV
jgi:hypothetical protein